MSDDGVAYARRIADQSLRAWLIQVGILTPAADVLARALNDDGRAALPIGPIVLQGQRLAIAPEHDDRRPWTRAAREAGNGPTRSGSGVPR